MADDLRTRIEALNKQPLHSVPNDLSGLRRKLARQAESRTSLPSAATVSSAAIEPVVYPRNVQRPSPLMSQAFETAETMALEQVVRGEVAAPPVGPNYYRIECAAIDVDECALELHAGFLPLLGYPEGTAVGRIAALCKSERIAPHDMLFLDIETTGLGNTPVFLIGTMESESDRFVFRQYFARDYSEEVSILSAFARRLADTRVLVTFNGKSFDMPYLQNRGIATAVRVPQPKYHLDLLHEARRHYGRSTPNHKLQTLEQHVCGRHRDDDIPGAEIPAAYHEFVRTGDARKIGLILQHNLRDLLTMADLMTRMWGR